ncbi:M28 family metallopeptidase [Bordetella pseudohinzii]|uniref:Uncharacterized conserved protein n=1 Tax=Bordetella pseudohinzii TaxID=1331258 RepID=A0A0J6C8R2_9BORD|nr:M28 family metallopeptidase [Bordetella pseudohinzii]ANY17542.1 hypothetical protein BBN53_17660 [Bordetella pseudohinzii]KMM25772.1 hypothetical protein L540_19250 [Bordetella pseudohinzii]KXA81759.1 hypothetical protein AW878_04060 [Bordetella pseudohinzii]KXA83001.1 hypothetical protein AW877_00295 [Bordetella pseudohinzii]CUI73567.1 Uncharacterized conserved protein [Bordetella pseudohinzii]
MDRLLQQIDMTALRRDVEHISQHIPTRLAGTPAGDEMARYSAGRLVQAGVDARVVATPGLVSVPGPARLEGEGLGYALQTCAHCGPTPLSGLLAEVVYAGGGTAGELEKASAAGKIVLVDLGLPPSRPEKHRLARAAGAVGLITINWGSDAGDALPYGSVKSVWGNPASQHELQDLEAALPAAGISRRDGLDLRARLKGRPLALRLHVQPENGWRTVHYTVGELAGQGQDFVIAGGHQDSWQGPSATDNATGSACLLALARLFGPRRAELRRGLVFAFWEGHETGGMLSSAHYADRNWERLGDHAVAYLQIDQPGCRGATRWSSHSNTQLRRYVQDCDARLFPDTERSWRRSTKIGDASFFGLGIPMLAGLASYSPQVLSANANAPFGWWHHTARNTLDKVDFASLERHMHAYASYLWDLCTLPLMPFDFSEVAAGLAERLRMLAGEGDPLALSPLAARLDRLADKAGGLARAVQACNRNPRDGRIERLDEAQKRLSRQLIHLESSACGRYGHDPYGLTAQSTLLPGLYDLPAWQALAPGPSRWRQETELWRTRNRVADATRDALQTIEAVL